MLPLRPPREAGTSASVCGLGGLGALPGERMHPQTGASAGKKGKVWERVPEVCIAILGSRLEKRQQGHGAMCVSTEFQRGPLLLIWSLHPPLVSRAGEEPRGRGRERKPSQQELSRIIPELHPACEIGLSSLSDQDLKEHPPLSPLRSLRRDDASPREEKPGPIKAAPACL